MIDTHCHLSHQKLVGDVGGVLQHARDAGVHGMLTVGYDLPSSKAGVSIAERERDVWAAVGVHPHDSNGFGTDDERQLRAMAISQRVVAIGEIGLDYHYGLSPRNSQRSAFAAQLQLALSLELPVVVHCREAYDDMFEIMDETRSGCRGVVHCWSGSLADAERALSLGLYLGVTGIVTFRKRDVLAEVVRMAPLDRLLLETDAPYLAPEPYRGKTNEPSFLPLIAQETARLRGTELTELEAATDENAQSLFSAFDIPACG